MVFTVTSSNCKVKLARFYEYYLHQVEDKQKVNLYRSFHSRTMFMRTYASSWEKRKSFYRKSELQMFLLSSGGHIDGAPIWRLHTKLYKGAWNVSANNSETVGHKDLRLGQIVYILVFYNSSFFDFFHWTVANLFFCCVTVNDLYGWRHGRVIQRGAWFLKVPAPACYSFCELRK